MRRFALPWLVVFLLPVGWGCAAKVPPASPEATAMAIQASAAPEPSEAALLPEPVEENQSFRMLDGTPRYKIGPGDVLEILLTKGFTQEKHTVGVKSDGMVTVAFFNAKVTGLTTEQAADEILRIMGPFYKQLGVDVLVKEYKSKKVAILGAVRGTPGTYPLQGRTSLLDLLAEAGGPAPTANLDRVRLIRADGLAYTVNVHRMLSNGTAAPDLVLDARDIVFIPSVEEQKVFALGEVKNPGAFPMVPNMRLSHLLAQAGGAKDTAVLDSARVIRGNLNKPQILAVNFQRLLEEGDVSQDLRLEVNDVVLLPRSGIGDWNAFLDKIRPTLQIMTLPLQPAVDILLIRDLLNR